MNKKIILLLAVLAVLALLAVLIFWYFVKNSSSNEPIDDLTGRPTKELIVSGHPEWPPIMYRQNDQIVGAGPEIVKKIFSDLGISVVSKYEGPWDLVQDKAKSGAVDVLAAAYKTAARETYMDYSIPYTVDPVVLVVKKGRTFPYAEWDDLITKKGVVTSGDSYGQDFDNFIKEKLTVKEVATPAEAFALLDQAEVDYFVYALYSAENYLFAHKVSTQFEIIPQYVSAENFYLTISKKSPFIYLLPQVNDLLKKYQDDGTIERIIKNNKQSLWDKNN
jgi:polar amino acid transport system substrate-binding protein